MVQLKRSAMRIIDDAFDMHGGYVLHFSDRTMREYFEDEFGIEIYQEKYAFNGTSKAKHLRAFIATEDAGLGRILINDSQEARKVIQGSERSLAMARYDL